MNTVDAICDICGEPVRWLSGTPRVCERCRYGKDGPGTPNVCETCRRPKDGHTHIVENCPNCDDGCKATRLCDGCDETICDACWRERNKSAPCHTGVTTAPPTTKHCPDCEYTSCPGVTCAPGKGSPLPEKVYVALCGCLDTDEPCDPSAVVLTVSYDRAKAVAALDDGHSVGEEGGVYGRVYANPRYEEGPHEHRIQEIELS